MALAMIDKPAARKDRAEWPLALREEGDSVNTDRAYWMPGTSPAMTND